MSPRRFSTRDPFANSSRVTRARVGIWALALTTCAAPAAERVQIEAPPGRRGESTAERLHRHGVNCMDELEREDCAVRYFRQLVDLDPPERELVGDATFRLIRIYKRRGDQEAVTELTRNFWDAGMQRRNIAALPHTAHYFPEGISMVSSFDLERFHASPLGQSLDDDSRDWLLTCDEERRQALSEARAQRRRARAESTGNEATPPPAEQPHERDRKRNRTVYDDGHCQLARALGQSDLSSWKRTVNGQRHDDPALSVSLVTMQDARQQLHRAAEAGKLIERGNDTYALPDVKYDDDEVVVAVLDADEITLAPPPVLETIRSHLDARQETLSAELEGYAERIPQDASMFVVMSGEAMRKGFSEAGALAQLLPAPDGLLVGVVLYRYSGLFARMPTSDPLRMQLAVPVLYRMMQSDAATVGDGESKASVGEPGVFGDLDLASSADGKAITFSAVLSLDQTSRLLNGDF